MYLKFQLKSFCNCLYMTSITNVSTLWDTAQEYRKLKGWSRATTIMTMVVKELCSFIKDESLQLNLEGSCDPTK